MPVRPARGPRPAPAPPTAEQWELVARALPLARWFADRKAAAAALPWLFDDYLDGAIDGLISAALAFDPGRRVPFQGLARVAVRRALIDVDKARYRDKRSALLHSVPLDIDLEGEGRLDGHEPAIEGRFADGEPDFAGLVEGLPEFERQVLSLRFEAGLDAPEIGRRLGRSQGTINLRQRQALARLRAMPTLTSIRRRR